MREKLDNEIFVPANCIALSSTFKKKITHRTQNGFVGGRHVLNNLGDIDACSRIFFMMYVDCHISNPKNISRAAAFDFEATFPSVIHEWIWMVLLHCKMPLHFITLFRSVYKKARAIYIHKGTTNTLITFSSGVLQGCPASACFSTNALDSFLTSFDNVLRANKAGIVRACSDDIGIALRRLKNLQLIYPI